MQGEHKMKQEYISAAVCSIPAAIMSAIAIIAAIAIASSNAGRMDDSAKKTESLNVRIQAEEQATAEIVKSELALEVKKFVETQEIAAKIREDMAKAQSYIDRLERAKEIAATADGSSLNQP